jgi:hypothetical protein
MWQVSSHRKPTKSLAQPASEPTLDERCDLVKAHVASLPVRLLCCTGATLVGASRQDNMKKSRLDVMMVLPNSSATEITLQQSTVAPSPQARFLLQIREHTVGTLRGRAPVLPRVPRLWTPPPAREGSGATTRPADPDPTSPLGRVSAPPRVPLPVGDE